MTNTLYTIRAVDQSLPRGERERLVWAAQADADVANINPRQQARERRSVHSRSGRVGDGCSLSEWVREGSLRQLRNEPAAM